MSCRAWNIRATAALDGEPNARTLALWHVDRGHRRLYFDADSRPAKYAEPQRARAVFHWNDAGEARATWWYP